MTKQEKIEIENIMWEALSLIESLKSEVSSLKKELKELHRLDLTIVTSLHKLRRKSLWATYRLNY